MPRPPATNGSVVTPQPTALYAAGMRVPKERNQFATSDSSNWQQQAWYYYDRIGELRYAANWVASVLSRATLYAATRDGRSYVESKDATATQVIDEFFGGSIGQAQALSRIGIHLFVAGECFIVQRAPRPDRREKSKTDIWEVVGRQEMQVTGRTWKIHYDDGLPDVTLADNEVIIRLWHPHPRKRVEADSPVRAVLGALQEIERASQHIMSQLISRLVSAGVLFLPQGMTFPTPVDSSLPVDATDADKFMSVLVEAMTRAIQEPGTAAAAVPIVTTVPDALVDKPQLLHFWSELDKEAGAIRQEAIRRLGLGLDIPVEVLLGTADLNHWSAWQVDEASIKTHIEPVLELIVGALSTEYLQVVVDDAAQVVRYDTSQLRLRPNRSKEAIELYDRGELDGEALRRETGFSDDDMPTPDEWNTWQLRKVASGSTTPELVAEALRLLGVMDLPPESDAPTTEAPPPRSLRDHPARELPEEPSAASIGMTAAAEVLVFRALERAGNRLKSKRALRPEGVTAADLYLHIAASPRDLDSLMEDAWSCVPRVMKGVPYDQQVAVTAAMDSYVRSLLLSQKEYDQADLRRYFTHTPVRQLA